MPGYAYDDVEYRIPKNFVSLSHGMLFLIINALKKAEQGIAGWSSLLGYFATFLSSALCRFASDSVVSGEAAAAAFVN
jgi:hypothetical protein